LKHVSVLLMVLGACAGHIAPYKPKTRTYDSGDIAPTVTPTGGSLYAANGRGMFEDDRARRLGDVLVIRIDEAEAASRDAATNLDKSNSQKMGLPASMGMLGLLTAKVPGLDPANLISANSDSKFAGKGQVSRSGKLTATLPVRVRKVLGNGDLFVEGTKVVMVDNEEHHLYVSGVIRQADILPDNSVLSSRVADAEIEYAGRGDVSDQQRPGWLSRILTAIWPF
jgi:flagellar L-ring protein precursor FlgH